ncbi:MAG: GntR family transcriptional regulator [Oscillospiraceae bacterium]|nr:GntR family transcriptional regulator [Oscillospiraceae bacterium]
MPDLYQINPELDLPIYRQLADRIRGNIRVGAMTPGMQLPTVRDLAAALGIARGTVKRAYDELEAAGAVEKVQGRGTFVRQRQESSDSRKEQAMTAIDGMLEKLEALGFSASEINIFLNLKLRERAEGQSGIKVAVIECNPEVLAQLTEQLRALAQVDLYPHLLGDVAAYPYRIGEEMDLIVTTAEHAAALQSILERPKLAKIALRLAPKSVAGIIKLQPGETVGILCSSERFGELIYGVCAAYTERVVVTRPCLLEKDLDCAAFFADKTAVLLPEGYEKYCTPEIREQIRRFGEEKRLILCAYQVEEGSLLYLEDKIERLREKKRI